MSLIDSLALWNELKVNNTFMLEKVMSIFFICDINMRDPFEPFVPLESTRFSQLHPHKTREHCTSVTSVPS
jgi:hypothetical protein